MKFVEETLVEKGHRAVFARSNIDTANATQWRLVLQIHALTDELSGSMYAPNIRAAHEGLFEKGFVVHTLPFGYRGIDIPGTLTRRQRPRRKVAVDPAEAEWVGKIFQWFVHDRLCIQRILERLNELGAPLPPQSDNDYWTQKAVRYLLGNPCYRGWWVYGKGENVWVSEKDYVKRRMRAAPLKEKQFEDRRLVSDADWFAAQRLLAEFRGRGGRKPGEGDRAKRPRVLNGLRYCKAHDRPLKVCGDYGQWMCCPTCMSLSWATRPLITYLNREQATRQVCVAVAGRIRADSELGSDVVRACRAAVARAGAADPARVGAARDRMARLTGQIAFVLSNAGETDGDRRESADRPRALRPDRAQAAAELAAIEAATARPPMIPTEAEAVGLLEDLAATLVPAAGGVDSPAEVGAVRAVLELITGGRIDVEQGGERRKCRGFLIGRFAPRLLATALARLPGGGFGEVEAAGELVIEFRAETIPAKLADTVKTMADAGKLLAAIADKLGIDRHQVTAALRYRYERRGLPAPPDGRVRRAAVPNKNRVEPVFRRLADEAKRLYDEGPLVYEIGERLGVTRDTVREAIRYWFKGRGLALPDGRGRRKGLARQGRERGGQGPTG